VTPLLRSWIVGVTAAEFAGFAVPATVGALTADAPAGIAVPAVLAAGAVEGAMLGAGQARVLRTVVPGFAARRWVTVTAVAAVIAYAIGLVPSVFAEVWRHRPLLAAAVGVPLAVALLSSIGTAQWLVLRRFAGRAGRWIGTTAAAWLAGLTVFLAFTMPLWHAGQPVAAVILIGLAGGLLMAATTSALTGWALIHQVRLPAPSIR
jgi:hypothetical protein